MLVGSQGFHVVHLLLQAELHPPQASLLPKHDEEHLFLLAGPAEGRVLQEHQLRLDWLGADTQGGAGQARHSALLEFMDAEGRLDVS